MTRVIMLMQVVGLNYIFIVTSDCMEGMHHNVWSGCIKNNRAHPTSRPVMTLLQQLYLLLLHILTLEHSPDIWAVPS